MAITRTFYISLVKKRIIQKFIAESMSKSDDHHMRIIKNIWNYQSEIEFVSVFLPNLNFE